MFVKCFFIGYNVFGDYMYIKKNKDILVIKKYNSFFQKLNGFMFKKEANYGIYFKNCNSIHTFFCFFPIDIYLLDKNNNILYVYKNIKKNKIILPKKGVKNIIEIPSGLYDELIIKDDN